MIANPPPTSQLWKKKNNSHWTAVVEKDWSVRINKERLNKQNVRELVHIHTQP
jgi:hypothetical protein